MTIADDLIWAPAGTPTKMRNGACFRRRSVNPFGYGRPNSSAATDVATGVFQSGHAKRHLRIIRIENTAFSDVWRDARRIGKQLVEKGKCFNETSTQRRHLKCDQGIAPTGYDQKPSQHLVGMTGQS